jgi:glycerol kinase
MSGRYILALDQGTSSSRALVVDAAGAVVAARAHEFAQIYPQPGWVAHDPNEIWNSQLRAAREAIAASGIRAAEIAAIGIANQRETTIVWRRSTGDPIGDAVVWQCRRTAPACERLREDGFEPLFRHRTGLVLDAYFSGTKIAWLLDNVPGARAQAEARELAFGTVDSWLLHCLTGGRIHATDRTNASRTLLFNLDTGSWDSELCDILRVPESMLPEVQPSGSLYGTTDPEIFGRSIPITGIAGDQQAALYGQSCYTDGAMKNTYGTGCFALRHTGANVRRTGGGLLATAAATCGPAPAFALEGSIFVAGAAVQWLRDGLGIIKSAPEVEALAASVPDTGGVQFVPAFVGLGAPHWDPYARGTIVGLTRGSTAAHIARATLEAIAFQTRDVIDLFDAAAGTPGSDLRVDGGAASNDLLMQIQADLLGRPVLRPRVNETTALGASYLAGLGAGLWSSEEEVASLWELDRRFEPQIGADQREERYALWRRAVERALRWAAPAEHEERLARSKDAGSSRR